MEIIFFEEFLLREIVQIVRLNEGDEFLSYFPSYISVHESVKKTFSRLATRMQNLYHQMKQDRTRMLKPGNVSETLHNSVLEMINKKVDSAQDWLSKCDLQRVIELILQEQTPSEKEETELSQLLQSRKKKKKKKKSRQQLLPPNDDEKQGEELPYQIVRKKRKPKKVETFTLDEIDQAFKEIEQEEKNKHFSKSKKSKKKK